MEPGYVFWLEKKMRLDLLAIFENILGGNGILEWLLWWELGVTWVTTHQSVLLQHKDRQRGVRLSIQKTALKQSV